jgi:hypothetical protein
MTRSELAGWLLLASFALWWPVGAVPSLYRVWPAPLDEKLALIGGRRRTWQALNLFMAAAAVLLVLGFAALTEPLEQAGGAFWCSSRSPRCSSAPASGWPASSFASPQ